MRHNDSYMSGVSNLGDKANMNESSYYSFVRSLQHDFRFIHLVTNADSTIAGDCHVACTSLKGLFRIPAEANAWNTRLLITIPDTTVSWDNSGTAQNVWFTLKGNVIEPGLLAIDYEEKVEDEFIARVWKQITRIELTMFVDNKIVQTQVESPIELNLKLYTPSMILK